MKKVFIVAIGTTPGEAVLEFVAQMQSRPSLPGQDSIYYTYYIDTNDVLAKSRKVAQNQFFHISIPKRYMDNKTAEQLKEDAQLSAVVYPGPLPTTSSTGAGGVRYAAAIALLLSYKELRKEMRRRINMLATQGDGGRDISFVIIASAAGGTGSGTADLLLDVIMNAASDEGIEEVRCDIILMHPNSGAENWRFANAEALYAEMTALRESDDPEAFARNEDYKGRILVIGSGGQTVSMATLDDLKRTVAALIRLTSDPCMMITQDYWSSMIDKHVLRNTDAEGLLIPCFSTAVPVVIGMGDLTKQIINADVARLLRMVLGTPTQDGQGRPANDLRKIFPFWQGKMAADDHRKLLDDISREVSVDFLDALPSDIARRRRPDQAKDLRVLWSEEDSKFREVGLGRILTNAQELLDSCLEKLKVERVKYIESGRTLAQLIADYEAVIACMEALKRVAEQYQPTQRARVQDIKNDLDALGRNQNRSYQAIGSDIESALEAMRLQEANRWAKELLGRITNECNSTVTKLRAFEQAARRQYSNRPGWETLHPDLEIHSDYPLYMPAMTRPSELQHYYELVSFFLIEKSSESNQLRKSTTRVDPLAQFRQALIDEGLVEGFFTEKAEAIFKLIERLVTETVLKNRERYTLLDVLRLAGERTLQESMERALQRAQTLLPYVEKYAVSRDGVRYVSAYWRDEAQHTALLDVIDKIDPAIKLVKSECATEEIAVLLLIDGLSMAAVNDMAGRGLEALIPERENWEREKDKIRSIGKVKPIYRGKDAEKLVCENGVIKRLWQAKGRGLRGQDEPPLPEFE